MLNQRKYLWILLAGFVAASSLAFRPAGLAPVASSLSVTPGSELDRMVDCQRTVLTSLSHVEGVSIDTADVGELTTACTRSLATGVPTFARCVQRLAAEVGSEIVNSSDGTPRPFSETCQTRSDEPYVNCVVELRRKTRFDLSVISEGCVRESGPVYRGCMTRRSAEFMATRLERDTRIGSECLAEAHTDDLREVTARYVPASLRKSARR